MSDKEVIEGVQPNLKKLPIRSQVTLKEIFGESISFEEFFTIFCSLQWSEIWSSPGAWVEESRPKMGSHTTKNFKLAKDFSRRKIQYNLEKRTKIKGKLKSYLGNNRLLCIPTTPSLAPKIGSIGTNRTKGGYYPKLLGLNALAGLGSLPQITAPIGSYDNVPLGLSFLASEGSDEFLIRSVIDLLKQI